MATTTPSVAATTTSTIVDNKKLGYPTTISHTLDVESQKITDTDVVFDYAKRAQWLRAAVLGANDGLLSTASLMMGVGAVSTDVKTMVLSGVAGLVAGACSMAIGEFVSVYSQYDIEMSQINRDIKKNGTTSEELEDKKKDLPSPMSAAVASGVAFAVGAAVPLLAAAFIKSYHFRLVAVVVAASLTLIGFGILSAVLGKAPILKSTIRVLFGGWVAMAVTFGLTKAVGSAGIH